MGGPVLFSTVYRDTYKRRGVLFSTVCYWGSIQKAHCALLGYRHTYKRMCPGADGTRSRISVFIYSKAPSPECPTL